MSLLKNGEHFFDHYIGSGACLEFKCTYHSRDRIQDSLGELEGYTKEFTATQELRHVWVRGLHVTLQGVIALLPTLFPMSEMSHNGKSLYYYSDFEFVRAIKHDHTVTLD